MYRILFVCTGNICRSPTAEAVFRHKVRARGLEDRFHIDSAGRHGYHVGNAPDHRSIKTALSRGVDMSDLVARKFTAKDFSDFDLLLAMDRGHFDLMNPHTKTGSGKLAMFLDWHPQYKGHDVPDPYYGDQAGFDHVYHLIDEGSERLLEYLLAENPK